MLAALFASWRAMLQSCMRAWPVNAGNPRENQIVAAALEEFGTRTRTHDTQQVMTMGFCVVKSRDMRLAAP